jgi:hypothetical protein
MPLSQKRLLAWHSFIGPDQGISTSGPDCSYQHAKIHVARVMLSEWRVLEISTRLRWSQAVLICMHHSLMLIAKAGN